MLSTVNVPPPKSSSLSLFALARFATSAIATLRPWIESWSASRITGHDQAVVDRHRDADVDPALGEQAPSVQWALKVGLRLSASADALTTNGT